MNKKLWIITVATVALLGTSTVIAAQSPGIISKAKAKETALKAVNGVVEEIDLERERGKLVYEVEVQKSGSSQDTTVIIDAKTGELIAIYEDDADEAKAWKAQKASNGSGGAAQAASNAAAANTASKEKASGATAAKANGQASGAAAATTGSQASANNSSSSNGSVKSESAASNSAGAATRTLLTKEQVKKIALDTVTGTIIEIDLDKDDGVVKYEVDVRTAQGKAELDIDAYSGKVLSQKLDDDDDKYDDDDSYDHDDDRYDDDYDDKYDDDRYDDDYDDRD